MAKGGAPMWLIILGLFLVQVGFGGYGIVLKKFAQNAGADALVFSICRDGFAFPVLLISAFVFERNFPRPALSELPIFLVLGATGMFGNQFMFIEGLYYTTPSTASIFQPLIPIFTAVLSFMLCLDRLPGPGRQYQWLKVAGIVIGAGGAILMTLSRPTTTALEVSLLHHNATHAGGACGLVDGTAVSVAAGCHLPSALGLPANGSGVELGCNASTTLATITYYSDKLCKTATGPAAALGNTTCLDGPHHGVTVACEKKKAGVADNEVLGITALFLNCLCMAGYVIIQKTTVFRAGARMHRWAKYPIAVTALSYFFGAATMALAAAIRFAVNGDKSVFSIPKATIPGLVYAVFISSSLCYGLITWCNQNLSSPSIVTAFWPAQVLITVILSYFVFNEQLVMLEYAGMAGIIVGMLSVTYGNYLENQATAAASSDLDKERKPLLLNE